MGAVVRNPAHLARVVCLALSVAACGAGPQRWTDTPFERAAADAASTFSAAAEILERAHARSVTETYLRGSLQVFAEQLDGLDAQLSSLEGRPDRAVIADLIATYGRAKATIDEPCIGSDCGWHEQVGALRAAAQAFLRAVSG